jgi:hypothetical protein
MFKKKPDLSELQTRFVVVALGSERRKKRIMMFSAIGAVVGVGAAVFAIRTFEAKEKEEMGAAWSSLSTCLLGGPLGDRETPGQRARSIQLAVMGVPRERRSKASELPWPSRCAEFAHTVAEHAKTGDAEKTGLAPASEALAKQLREDQTATSDLRAPVDKLWKEADKAGLKSGQAPADVPAAPKPSTAMTLDQFRDVPKFLSGSFQLTNLRFDPAPVSKVTFLIDQKDQPEGPVICSINATDEKARCQKVPASASRLSPGLRLVGTTDDGARPFFFAGDRGSLGIIPPEGGDKNVPTIAVAGSSARADGSMLFLAKRPPINDLRVTFQPATGSPAERSVLQPTDVESEKYAGLFWDWLVYKGAAKGNDKPHLFAKKLPDNATSDLGPTIDIGEIDEPSATDLEADELPISACKTSEAMAVRVRGKTKDSIAFLTGGRWSAPQKSSVRGGVLTCRGLEAIATKVTHVIEQEKDLATIAESKCDSSGCAPSNASLKEMLAGISDIAPADLHSLAAADVGGKLVVAWSGGSVGGVRMRTAAPDRIKDAEDTVLFDARDEDNAMKLSTFLDMKLVPASTFGALFVSTTSGVRVFRVDSSGKVTPISASL